MESRQGSTRSFAVIGCGTIGGLRARIASEHAMVDELVLFDSDVSKARRLASELGSASVAASARDAVERDDVCGVFVSTSEHQHVEPALEAVDAGRPVLVEKPLAHELHDAKRLARHADSVGVPVYVGYTQRFRRRFLNSREQIRRDKLGSISAIAGKRYLSRAVSEKIGLRTDKVTPASDSLTYVVDICLWYLSGLDPVQVVARSNYSTGNGARRRPEASWALLEMNNGTICNLSVTWQLPKHHPTGFIIGLDVFGDRGFLSIDDSHSEVIMSSEEGADLLYTPGVHPQVAYVGTTPAGEWVEGRFWGPLRHETETFIATAVIGDGTAPILATARDACRVLAVTEAIDTAASSREAVDIDWRL